MSRPRRKSRAKARATGAGGKQGSSKVSRPASKATRVGAGPGGRERLFDAATLLFAQKGYAATGIAELCGEAGVAKTALYWHFENKEGLLAEVVTRVGNRWIEQLRRAAEGEGSPRARLERLTGEWRRIICLLYTSPSPRDRG